MTVHLTTTAAPSTTSSQTVHPDSLEALVVLSEAGLFRHHKVEVDNQHQCAAWGPSTRFDEIGRLIYLDLGGCRLRKGWPIEENSMVLEKLAQSLKTLNLGGTDLPVQDTIRVLKALSQSLEEVHLGGNGLGDNGVSELAREWLPKAVCLHTLDLRYNDITGVGCETLCQGGLKLPQSTLIKLYLEGNRIQDKGSEALALWLQENASLQELFLGSNSIGAVGGMALAQCLKTNKTLTKIYLERNTIGPDGAEAFTKMLLDLKGDTSLKHLFVDNNGIGKEGSKKLAQALNSATAIGDSLLEG